MLFLYRFLLKDGQLWLCESQARQVCEIIYIYDNVHYVCVTSELMHCQVFYEFVITLNNISALIEILFVVLISG